MLPQFEHKPPRWGSDHVPQKGQRVIWLVVLDVEVGADFHVADVEELAEHPGDEEAEDLVVAEVIVSFDSDNTAVEVVVGVVDDAHDPEVGEFDVGGWGGVLVVRQGRVSIRR